MRKLRILILFGLLSAITFNVRAQDLGVSIIISPPINGCNLDTVTNVNVLIQNFGAIAVSNYTITFSVDGVSSTPELITTSIPASSSQLVLLATKADVSKYGTTDFKVWTTNVGDLVPTNDTAFRTIKNDTTPVGGVILSSDTVCSGFNGATLNLINNVGPVVDWETSPNGSVWTTIAPTVLDSSFTYSNLTATKHYRVKVRNNCGPAFSTPAIITVDPNSVAGTITGAGAVCAGSSGTLTLTGYLADTIKWESAQSLAGPWTLRSSTTDTLNFNNIQVTSDTLFRARVKLGVCSEDTTPVVVLTLDKASQGGGIIFTGNDTVCSPGSSKTLAVFGNVGTVDTWQVSTNGGTTYTSIGGSAGQANILSGVLTQTSLYRVLVTNGSCPQAISASATITVTPASIGGGVSGSTTVCQGGSGGLILSGKLGSVMHWEKSINGGTTWDTITPITTDTFFNYNSIMVTTLFRAKVKNGLYCNPAASASATITVNAPTVAGTASTAGPTSVCAGNNGDTLVYVGGNGSVQDWEQSTNGGATFVSVPGPPVIAGSYIYSNITTTTLYRVVVKNGQCDSAFSNAVTITVLPASVAGSISGTSTLCSGDTAALSLTGQSGNVLTWLVSTDDITYSSVPSSALLTSLSPVVVTTSFFKAVVQQGTCESDTTVSFQVKASPNTVGGTVSSAATECGGNNGATLTLAGNVGKVLQWIRSTNGGASWTGAPGSDTINTYTYTNLNQTTLFKARVKSGVCVEDSSASVTITVIPAALGGTPTLLSADTLCADTLTTTIQLSGQTGTVIGWQASENGGATFTKITGAVGTPVAFSYPYTTNTLFRAMVRNGASCDTVFSATKLVVVGSSSIGGNTAGTDTVCGGTNNGFVTLSGENGGVLRWESSTNSGATWTPQPNSDSVAFNYVGLNNTTWFRAIVQDATCPQAISDTVKIEIIPAAIAGVVAYAGPNVCSGTNNFTLNLSGSSGTILRWEKSLNGTVWSSIINGSTSLNDSDITATTHYRAVLQTGSCPEVNAIPDTVFVDALSNAGIIAGSTTLCDTGNAGSVSISGFTGSIQGWQSQINSGGFGAIFDVGNDTTLYTNLVAGTHEYKAIVTNGVCPNDTSALATIVVDPNVIAGTLSGGTSYCTTTNSTLLTLSGYSTTVVNWERSTNGGTSWSTVASSSNRDTITFKNIAIPTMYRVIVSSGLCGLDTSNVQSIDVGLSVGGTLTSSDSVCISGFSGVLNLAGQVGTILTWQDSLPGMGWVDQVPVNTTDSFAYSNANLLQTTSFRVAVQSGTCDTSFSSIVTIVVNDTVSAGTLSSNLFFCDTTNSDTLLMTNYFGPILNWQVSVDGGPFTNFSPAKTDSAYIFNNIQDSSSVFRIIMNGGVCGSDTSNSVSVEVGASLAGTLTIGDTVCSGNNMGVLKLSDFKGNILGWDSSTVAGIFAPMAHTADSLIYIDLSDTVTYRVRVQNPGCPPDTSNEVVIVTVPGTNSGNLTGSRSICSPTNMDSVILVGRNGVIDLWQRSTDFGVTWMSMPTQLTDTFVYTNLDSSTMYRVVIQASGLCPNDTSNIAFVQVGPSDAGIISGDTLLCAGSLANLSVTGFTGSVVAWENSNDGIVWNPIPQTDTSDITDPVFQNTFYRVIVQSDTCASDTSASFQVKADQPFTGSLTTPTTQLCYGAGADTIFISGTVDAVIDWEFRENNVPSFTSLGNTGLFQTYNNLIITTHYRAMVKNGVCPVDTTNITLTVDTFTVAGSIVANDTICSGTNTGTLLLSGHIGNNFTWQSSTDGGMIWGAAPGATNDTFYVYNNLTATTEYRLVVASGGCPADTTNEVNISVKPSAIGGMVSMDTSYCKGPNSGVLNLSGYFGNIVGWQQSIGGSGFTNITPPIVIDSLLYNNIDTTTTYRVILSFGDCPDDTSASASITILKTPITAVTPSGPVEFCFGGSVTLTAIGGPNYLWNTGDTLNALFVDSTGNYVVEVTDPITGCADKDSIFVNAYPLPNVNAGNDIVIFEGQSANLLATGASAYEWSPKAGLSDGFIPNPVATPLDSTVFVVIGIDSNGCEGMDTVLIGVIPTEPEGPPEFTNLFTPNGDGYNDYWNITTLANCVTCKVSIYNRYGQQVLQDNNYQNDWEGTFGGAKLPDGTYYYVIETESGKIYKGAVSILRGE